ncbi:M48 family metallopeptidase [Flavobacterium sp. AJR]|uniref:M48 family metallopeptidase n=1 Tax=Flavobacterium sp. AJR TaxID=1979369 RepID=UPI001F6153C2|nr:SprT family zinc-dependent metalloprotease [Flavobacterium sp. AJR]
MKIGTLEIEVKFKPIKNLHLSVHPPYGKVTVSSPDFFELEKVRVYLTTKIGWIKQEQRKISSQEREAEKLFITRESHQFLGKRYLLKIKESEKNKIVLKHSAIDLYTKQGATTDIKKKILYNWYRKELRLQLSTLIHLYASIMNLNTPEFGIRIMKTKWGSCITENKKLWFNIELAKKPIDCIEYIVVHEMVHLLERNHNKNFILMMDKYLPNWRTQKKILNELPI